MFDQMKQIVENNERSDIFIFNIHDKFIMYYVSSKCVYINMNHDKFLFMQLH